MKISWPFLMVTLAILPSNAVKAISPAFGNIEVVQNNNSNAANGISLSLSYSQAALSADGFSSLGTLNLRAGSNRGDYMVRFTANAANDRAQGILITNVSQLARDNSASGDPAGAYFATSATTNDANGYFVALHAATSDGSEFNANVAAAWFAYEDGWIGGHAVNSVNGGPLTSLVGSPGLSLSSTGAGPNILYDANATGVYELNLGGINSQTDGILLVSGGRNEDNYALSRANADGTWTLQVRDNYSGSGTEADGIAFVYVPKTAAVTGDAPGVHAMGRLNGNLTRDISAGDYAMVRSSTGVYYLYAPGMDPAQSSLLISPEAAGVNGDNILFYEAAGKGWRIENRDLTPLGLQDNTATEDTLSFALMASRNSAGYWTSGGGNNNWSNGSNWASGSVPAAGRDVVLGGASATVNVDSAQSAGMVFINSNTAFTLAGPGTLSLSSGLIVNAQPTSAQIYTVSAPLALTDHAFVLAQTLGSTVTLRLDVASGNAVSGTDKNLTLGGGSAIEIRDPMSLGTGILIKEGANQVTLTTAHSMGGVNIIAGPNNQSSGAFRLNAAAAYGGFGSAEINLINTESMTALYFDSGAGSGNLPNNISLQSSSTAHARFLVDTVATLNATLSGIISGGNTTSDFIVDADAANGQGKLHLANTANTFLAQRVNINRGALVIYGDGSLGNSSNSLYLNTNNTNGNTGSGLHFGADNITVAASRSVVVNTLSVINTGAFQATIAGEISGAGGLVKAGNGTLTLGQANLYEGGTTVAAGRLMLAAPTGSATGLGAVTINNGGSMAGSGRVSGMTTFQSGSRLTPGGSAGTLVFGSGLDLQGGSITILELLSPSEYDRVQVVGGALQTAADSRFEISLQYTPQAGDVFDLLDWTTLTGDTDLVDNLTVPNISDLGLQWDYSLFNSTGVLSIQLVPEPSRGLLCVLGAGCILLRRRRA